MNTNFLLDWEVSPIEINTEFGTNQIFKIPLGFISTGGSGGGSVNSVNGKLPNILGDVVLTANDLGAASDADLATLQEQLNNLEDSFQPIPERVLDVENELTSVSANLTDVENELVVVKNTQTTMQGSITTLQNNKLDRSDYIQHFKGVFMSLQALSAAFPVASDGDYAHIDQGIGFDRIAAIWDSSDLKWVASSSNVGANTDEVPEGNQNLYFKTSRVLGTQLTGLGTGADEPILDTDTILQALQKLQAQVNSGGSSPQIEWIKASQVGTMHPQFQPSAVIGSATVDLEFANINGLLYMRGAYTCLTDISVGARLIVLHDQYKVRAYIYGNVSTFTVPFNVYYRTNPTIENALVILSPSQALDPIIAAGVDQSINHYTNIENVGKAGVWIVGGMGNIVCLGQLINQ